MLHLQMIIVSMEVELIYFTISAVYFQRDRSAVAWHLMRHVCNERGLTVEVHGPGDCVFVFQSSLFSSVIMANS